MGKAPQIVESPGTRPWGEEEPETLEGPDGGQRGRNTVRHSEQGERERKRRRLREKEDQTTWGLGEQGFSNFNVGLVKVRIQTPVGLGWEPRFCLSDKLRGHALSSTAVTTIILEALGVLNRDVTRSDVTGVWRSTRKNTSRFNATRRGTISAILVRKGGRWVAEATEDCGE